MNTKNGTKTFMYRTAAIFMMAMMLFAALPASPAHAVSQNISSAATGTWEATAWPNTLRSGMISVTAGDTNVVGTGTAFLTELSVGNILRTTDDVMIGTVAAIINDTDLTLTNTPATTRTNIAYNGQGVGPADNVTITNGHTVTIAANPINQTGTVTVNAGSTLTISDPGTIFSMLIVDGTLTGTTDVAFGALTINNGGIVTAGTNGSYMASSLTINTGGTGNIFCDFSVSGATSISGTLNFSSTSVTARAIVFTGPVTLNAGATWTEPASGNGANNSYDFQNNFTNNASLFTTSGTAIHSFSGTGMTISGATNTSISQAAITGSYINSGIITVESNLFGAGSLTNSAAGTLHLGGISSISTLVNAGTFTKTGAGPITTVLANFTNTGTLNLNGTGTIAGITNNAGGTVNLDNSGTITAFNNATATSLLSISDLTPPTITTLTVSAAGSTVNYSGAGAQTVKPITYSNLIFSGSGTKSITMSSGSTLANGNLNITPGGNVTASVTGTNLVVNSLSLGGFGKNSGTWGSTGSAAGNKDDNFFALKTGYLNITTDTRLSQTVSFASTAPLSGVVGGATYTPTATATSGLPVTFSIDPTASAVCSINAGVVSFNAAGICVINADQVGNTSYHAAIQIQQSFTIKNGQTINFTSTAPANAVVGGATYTPTATATSGLPVSFTIDATASSICSISVGIVSFLANGTCVIDAEVAGDATYLAATQQQSFGVKNGQTINFTSPAPASAAVGGATYTPTATATSGLPVTFTIDATAALVCSINAGVISFDAAGTCAINANQAGNATHNAALQAQQSFAVSGVPIFSDVLDGYWAKSYIERLYASGITAGCGSGNYCPEGLVTRAEMAIFLERGIHGSSYTPPALGSSTSFADVELTFWAAAWIKQLAADSITAGCGNGNYCPNASVTRAQMAVFLLKSKYGAAYTPPAVGASTGFGDVQLGYWADAWIKQLVLEGITAGCGSGNYCPGSPVTRAQMAVFLVKTFNLP